MNGSSSPIHVRTMRMEVTRVGERDLLVTGRLLDERPGGGAQWFGIRGSDPTVHDMEVTLRVRYPELVVTDVEARMPTHPYTICTDVLPQLRQLIGVSVARGFVRAVNERFGRQQGCSHLTALIQAMGPVVKQGAGAAFRDGQGLPEAEEDRWFVNTCQSWRENGPLHERLKAGDAEGIRRLSAYRGAARSPAPDANGTRRR